MAVRDSKDNGLGPVHIYTAVEIAAFFDGVKNGEFDDLIGQPTTPRPPPVALIFAQQSAMQQLTITLFQQQTVRKCWT